MFVFQQLKRYAIVPTAPHVIQILQRKQDVLQEWVCARIYVSSASTGAKACHGAGEH